MKTFYKRDGKLYVRNGKSHLRVGFMGHFTHPHCPGRVGKLLAVQEVISQSPTNPFMTGRLLALSFPEMKVNAQEYTWKPGEQFQMGDVKIQLHEQKRKNIITALDMDKENQN